MVESSWRELFNKYPLIDIDSFVVMPNHFHGIVMLNDGRGESCIRPLSTGDHKDQGDHKDRPYSGTREHSLGRILQAFKSMTTVEYIRGVQQSNWRPFPGRLWQRNYYESIIRNEAELDAARKYITENPTKWGEDNENLDNIP
jgi:putative transposase